MTYPQASRTTDPDTSHQAEAEITATGTRQAQADYCYSFVEKHPGMTYRELAKLSGCEDRNMFSRRLNDLRSKHRVTVGDSRRCKIGKRMMQTWYPVPEQGELI